MLAPDGRTLENFTIRGTTPEVRARLEHIGLINDLLDLSRLDENRLKPVIRAVDSGSIARRAVGRMISTAEAKGITIRLDITPELPSVETDASCVEQILMNLLWNAIKHAPDPVAYD